MNSGINLNMVLLEVIRAKAANTKGWDQYAIRNSVFHGKKLTFILGLPFILLTIPEVLM